MAASPMPALSPAQRTVIEFDGRTRTELMAEAGSANRPLQSPSNTLQSSSQVCIHVFVCTGCALEEGKNGEEKWGRWEFGKDRVQK